MINYEGTVSDMDVKQIYDWWWKSKRRQEGLRRLTEQNGERNA
jgi:hypothetical protein